MVTARRLPSEPDSLSLLFSVSDTGIGMTSAQMGNLFRAFHQADTSFTRQYGGTGLGLAISKHLVELMGGAIGMESRPGAGSTFSFTFHGPLVKDQVRKPSLSNRVNNTARILVVDDSEATRDELVQLLRHHGQLAFGAASGEEGLAALIAGAQRGNPFQLVIMDWRLPGINGAEASHRIRLHPELQPTPIVLMISAFDRDEIAPDAESAIFDEFLLKPIKEEFFLKTVWSLLDTPAGASPAYDPSLLMGRSVLLVDDNDLNRDLATELLGDLGIMVTLAMNGQAAVDCVRDYAFDLVLMDIQMPVMDGLTATRIIRSDRRFDPMPIIAMTAHAMTGDYERSLAAGMNDHITKPIDPAGLARTLAHWMPSTPAKAMKADPPLLATLPQETVPDHLPPFNIAAALQRTNNKPALLRKLLLGFQQEYTDAVAELRLFLYQEKWAEAQRLVHSLKSVAAMLETEPLAEASAALEAALRKGQRSGLEGMIDELDATLRPAIAAVSALSDVPYGCTESRCSGLLSRKSGYALRQSSHGPFFTYLK